MSLLLWEINDSLHKDANTSLLCEMSQFPVPEKKYLNYSLNLEERKFFGLVFLRFQFIVTLFCYLGLVLG